MSIKLLQIINKLGKWLTQPFREGLSFFLIIFIFSATLNVVGYALYYHIPKSIFITLHHYIICYVITLLVYSFRNKLRRILKGIIFFLLGINLLIDLTCLYSFHTTFDPEFPAIILGTNSNEVSEFLTCFFPPILGVLIIGCLLTVYLLNKSLQKFPIHIGPKLQYFALILVPLFYAITIYRDSPHWQNVSITKVLAFTNTASTPNLNIYRTSPNIKTKNKQQPKYVVMIIGESFAKKHSSLYGYKFNTNPRLNSLIKNQEQKMLVFNHVESPATGTVATFKCLMSTWNAKTDTIQWYKCLTLIDILKASGYQSYWFSNQSQKGLHDNIVAKYAALCDESHFTGNRFVGGHKFDLDGLLINLLHKELTKASPADSLQFHVIHLMGSHHDFKLRYPKNYEHFKTEDYSQFPENQRQTLAEYDNSILYNDYVVSELMKLYADKEAIVFYFSDHGLDVFNSRNDYVGHARHNDPKSVEAGLQIPFMVYLTPAYRQAFPEMSKRVEQAVNKPFCTQNMIYTIMDVIGVEFKNNDAVQQRSLFAQ